MNVITRNFTMVFIKRSQNSCTTEWYKFYSSNSTITSSCSHLQAQFQELREDEYRSWKRFTIYPGKRAIEGWRRSNKNDVQIACSKRIFQICSINFEALSSRSFRNNNLLGIGGEKFARGDTFPSIKYKIYNWLVANVLGDARVTSEFLIPIVIAAAKDSKNSWQSCGKLCNSSLFVRDRWNWVRKKYGIRRKKLVRHRGRSVINLKIWIMIRFKPTY